MGSVSLSYGELTLLEIDPAKAEEACLVMEKRIKKVQEAGADWTPLHLCSMLSSGNALMTLVIVKGRLAGMVVFVIKQRPTSRSLLIWQFQIDSWVSKSGFDYLTPGFRYMRDLAHRLGCDALEMETNRRGWSRILKRHGMMPFSMFYRMEIQ